MQVINFIVRALEISGTVAAIIIAVTGVVITLFKGALTTAINNWLNKAFLERNTTIVQEIQVNFNKALADYKLLLDQNLVDYKSNTDAELAKQIEPLKASLGKANISFQITHTEYVKRQFSHIEELHSLIYKLYRHSTLNYYYTVVADDQEYQNIRLLAEEKRTDVIIKLNNTSFFLPESSIEAVYKYASILTELIVDHEMYRAEKLSLNNSPLDRSERISIIQAIKLAKEEFLTKRQEFIDAYTNITFELRKLMTSSLSDQ